ncbi:HAD-IIIA family hydrolase [Candidatus Woesearchaeota archaeon]|nr:HAD-IIIA family hydrolase [Candidatus Woesearchaeota archaeon]
MKPLLIGIDRDGTLIENDGEFPGSKWPNETAKLMPGVVEGLKLLKTLDNVALVMVTNQSGPARGKVTLEQTTQFNAHVNALLRKHGVGLQKIYSCEHAPPAYAERYVKEGAFIDTRYIRECPDWKPGIGLLEKAARECFDLPLQECDVYMIGDRHTDPETGINAGGKGIFIESLLEAKHLAPAKDLQKKHGHRVYIAKDFLDAAHWIAGQH